MTDARGKGKIILTVYNPFTVPGGKYVIINEIENF